MMKRMGGMGLGKGKKGKTAAYARPTAAACLWLPRLQLIASRSSIVQGALKSYGSEAPPHPGRQDQAAAVPRRRHRQPLARATAGSSRSSAPTTRAPSRRRINIDNAKAVKWLREGAQPTERVQKLLEDLRRAGPSSARPERRSDRPADRRRRATPRDPAPTATAVLDARRPGHRRRSRRRDGRRASRARRRIDRSRCSVAPGDMGRVIGTRGRTAQSIRTVVRAAAARDGVEVDVDFVD